MISLKTYMFRDGENEIQAAYRRILDLFLQGIALHAVEGDRSDYERFQDDIGRFAKSLTPETSIADLFVIAGGAVRAMEDYNRRTSEFVRKLNDELQKMVSMLTRTIISIGASSETSVNKLQTIEKAIEGVRMVEDIQVLKMQLDECLHAVREETLRQKADRQAALENLQQELDGSRERMGSMAVRVLVDGATGLPGKNEALKAMQEAMASPKGKFLLVAVVSRVQAVNARFGYAVGDRVLEACAAHFKKNISARDQLFRWQGPALVGILDRHERIDHVSAEVRQFADTKLEKTVDVGNRTVLIPISCSWSVFQIAPPVEVLLKKLDIFTAAQIPRDYV
jgi:GGDEF domain-containing protein